MNEPVQTTRCPRCKGRGSVRARLCAHCGGKGYLVTGRAVIEVKRRRFRHDNHTNRRRKENGQCVGCGSFDLTGEMCEKCKAQRAETRAMRQFTSSIQSKSINGCARHQQR